MWYYKHMNKLTVNETWKDIKGYEGLYAISNMGRVKSFRQWKRASRPKEYILKSSIANTGYCQVTLYKDTKKKKFLVHRLVAEAFIPNPQNLPYINHKDENRINNNVENLEWCTAQYNNDYGTARLRTRLTQGHPVKQYLISGHWVATYATASIATEITGIPTVNINSCARGETQSAGGYIWSRCD